MTSFLSGLRVNGENVASRIGQAGRRIGRTMPGPALVRATASLAGLGAVAVSLPLAMVTTRPGLLLITVALGVGVFPRTKWVTITAVLAVGAYVISTIAFDVPITLWRVALLTALLYVMHSSAALAAVLPYDCAVAPGVLGRWYGRTLGVLGVSLAVGLSGLFLTEHVVAVRSVAGPIAGSVVAAILVGVLAWHVRRRDEDSTGQR
jgi:hypothetical protein